MTERNNDYVCTGWVPAIEKRATKAQLIALRDYLFSIGWGNSAAAVDNAIDCIQSDADMARRIEMASEKYDFTPMPKEMPDIDFNTVDEIPL